MDQVNENKRLGEERISKLLLEFCIPCIMGLLISAFYNIVDQIFIGNSELGYLGNAATGVSFPVICIANAFAWCVGDGAASFLSICAGRKDSESAHKCVGTGITVTLIISILLMIVGLIFAKPLLIAFGASDQTIQMALDYFNILVSFFPFYLLMNVTNSMIRADGSPSYAMKAMLVGAITNIILDPVFIYLLKWGIQGAAWATVIGQVLSFVMCIIYFRKPKTFVLTKESFIPDMSILRNTVSLGIATFVTQISIVIMSVVCNMMLAKYGSLSIYGPDIPISVFSIQSKVFTIILSIVTGIVLGGQPIFGFNYGAKNYARVKETFKIVLIACLIVGGIATLICQLCPLVIINLFGSGDALYQEFAILVFRIYLSFMIITLLVKVCAVFFQSIGKSVHAVVASLVRDILCLTPLTLLLPMILEGKEAGSGIMGVLYAAPISDLVTLVAILFLTIPFFKTLGKEENVVHEPVSITHSTPGFIITISREHGTKGKQIGKMLAERLNIPFYYKEMAALVAQESGLHEEFVSELNENSPNVLHDLYLSTDVVKQAVIAQEQVIRKIADEGSCVIVGRAADYVLRDYKNVKSIFIYAPTEYRVKNIMEMYNDSFASALANMHHSDRARSAYYRNIAQREWKDLHNYDLCIDASIGMEKCVELICDYLEK